MPTIGRVQIAVTNGRPLFASLVRYSLEDYDPDCFDAWGLARPLAIFRSVQKRQAEYLFGRLAARHALTALGLAPSEVTTGAHRQPIWPEYVIGSITHSHGYAAAVVAFAGECHGVGLDIEAVAHGEALHALMTTAMNHDELALLVALGPESLTPLLVALVFSAKEAFFKAAFSQVGHYFDFSAIRLLDVDFTARHLTISVQEALSPTLVPGRVVHLPWGMLGPDIVHTACLL